MCELSISMCHQHKRSSFCWFLIIICGVVCELSHYSLGCARKHFATALKLQSWHCDCKEKKRRVSFTVFHSHSSSSEPEPRFSLLSVLWVYLLLLLLNTTTSVEANVSCQWCCRETLVGGWGGDEMGGEGGHFSNVYTSVTRVFYYRESDRPVLFIYLFI